MKHSKIFIPVRGSLDYSTIKQSNTSTNDTMTFQLPIRPGFIRLLRMQNGIKDNTNTSDKADWQGAMLCRSFHASSKRRAYGCGSGEQ